MNSITDDRLYLQVIRLVVVDTLLFAMVSTVMAFIILIGDGKANLMAILGCKHLTPYHKVREVVLVTMGLPIVRQHWLA